MGVLKMKAVRKTFSLTYAELALFVSQTVANMTRDTAQFAVRGVTAATITAFEALGNAFEVFPPDEFYVGEIKDLTDQKNVLRETVTGEIQLISGFFLQQYGAESGKYSSLRIKGLQRMSEAEFLLTSRNVVEMATDNLSALTAIGLTQAMIDSLEDNAQLFEDKLIELNSKKEVRDDKARERVVLSNQLYNLLSLYCKIGKLIWKNVNEAKYNDYVIYPTVNSGLSKPQNLSAVYNMGTPGIITLSWDAVLDATSYNVYSSIRDIGAPSGTYNFLNPFPETSVPIPPVENKRNYFKIKAKNDTKISPYSDETFVDVIIL